MISIKEALSCATTTLKPSSPSPKIEAEILLQYVLDKTRAFLYTHPEQLLLPAQQEQFDALVGKRHDGHPVAYLTKQQEFWSLPLEVCDATLIPRADTERLVEVALTLIHSDHANILELGTGSGAIALALASEKPHWKIHAGDICQNALQVAKKNAENLKIHNVSFSQTHWFSSFKNQTFDAILSNPPYIAEDDPHLTQGDLRYEPQQALTSGKEGLDALTILIKNSAKHLRPGGFILLEHGYNQKTPVANLLANNGFHKIRCWQDNQGIDRVSGGFVY